MFVALLFSAFCCCRIFADLCTRWDQDLCSLYSDLQGPRRYQPLQDGEFIVRPNSSVYDTFQWPERFSREPGKISNFLCSRHLLNVLGPFFQTAEVKPIEASGMDLDDAKDKLEVKDKAVKDLSSEEMTSKVMANNTKYIKASPRKVKHKD